MNSYDNKLRDCLTLIWHKCVGGKYDQCSSLDLNINFMVKCHLFRRRHRRRSPLLIYLYRVKKWGRKSGANRRRPTNPIFKSLAASPPPAIIPSSHPNPNPNWCIKGNFVIACMSPDGGKKNPQFLHTGMSKMAGHRLREYRACGQFDQRNLARTFFTTLYYTGPFSKIPFWPYNYQALDFFLAC